MVDLIVVGGGWANGEEGWRLVWWGVTIESAAAVVGSGSSCWVREVGMMDVLIMGGRVVAFM